MNERAAKHGHVCEIQLIHHDFTKFASLQS